MLRLTRTLVFLLLVAWLGRPLAAEGDTQVKDVGLGLSIGATFPQGSTEKIQVSDWDGEFNWGFYVNIPLINSFHLTPSAELYRFREENATDIAMAFKFIVPVKEYSIYAGFVPGLTATGDVLAFHMGILGGFSSNLVSNLDAFVQVKYKFLFEGDRNMRVLHANCGILFHL